MQRAVFEVPLLGFKTRGASLGRRGRAVRAGRQAQILAQGRLQLARGGHLEALRRSGVAVDHLEEGRSPAGRQT